MFAALGVVILAGCDHEPLVHNLTEREANRLVTYLHAEGLEVTKVARPDGRYALEAPPERVVAALRYIEDNRLVRESIERNLEPAGLGSSKEDRRFRAERALSRSIEATLDSIPGVLESRVHLNVPPDDALFGGGAAPRSKATASVLIVAAHHANVPLVDIATLVGGAAGIPPSDVATVFRVVPARVSGEGTEPGRPNGPPAVAEGLSARLKRYIRSTGWEVGVSLVILGVGLLRFGFRPRRKKARRLRTSSEVASGGVSEHDVPATAGRVA